MATYDKATLRRIYDRTAGESHICWKKLAFTNYGKHGERGAWEVEHSIPRAVGGTDHLNNLYAAHTSCNRSKKHSTNYVARSEHGKTRAPNSAKKRKNERKENTVIGAGLCGLVGAAVAGPPGAVLGGIIGAAWGKSTKPKK